MRLTLPVLATIRASHVVAASLFLDSQLAEWAWLCGSPNLEQILSSVFVKSPSVVVLLTGQSLMPKHLVVEADLSFAFCAVNEWRGREFVLLAMSTTWSWTP